MPPPSRPKCLDLESAVQREILGVLMRNPRVMVFRQNVLSARAEGRFVKSGIKGQADITGCVLRPSGIGQRIEIECKSPGGHQTPDQKAFQKKIEAVGGIYILARNAQHAIKQVLDLLEK